MWTENGERYCIMAGKVQIVDLIIVEPEQINPNLKTAKTYIIYIYI